MESKAPQKNENKKFFLKLRPSINPVRNTIDLIIVYIVMGIAWIFLSDRILLLLVSDPRIVENIQLGKGIFYVLATALLFYIIIKRRMDLYMDSIHQLRRVNGEMEDSNRNLIRLEEKLYKIAYFDSLTGLLSKNKIAEIIQEHHQLHPNEIFAFVYIDVDNFRGLNELKGHEIGDELLKLIAEEMKTIAPAPHIVARLGGDEFVILVKDIKNREDLNFILQSYSVNLKKIFLLDGDEYFVTVSAGVSIYPDDGHSYEQLIRHADMALDVAKKQGRNAMVVYQQEYKKTIMHHLELANIFQNAVPNGEFRMYYQPIYSSKEEQPVSVEALMRWQHNTRGFIAPNDFIPIAEMTGKIKELTWFAFRECFDQSIAWKKQGLHLNISMNLSAKVILLDDFIERIEYLLKAHQTDPHDFILEVTESILLEKIDDTIAKLHRLKDMGFSIALDDFGTGYSSLTYLEKLPFNILKIDRSFITNILSGSGDYPLLTFMIDLAHKLGKTVVAEGVEDKVQRDKLCELGVDFIQGYFYAKPMPANAIEPFIKIKR